MNQWRKLGPGEISGQVRADLAASAQAAIVDVLVSKSMRALEQTGLRRLVVAGGVGANAHLRERLDSQCASRGIRVHYPELALCSDNGAMIALAAAMRLQSGLRPEEGPGCFEVLPRWPLTQVSGPVTDPHKAPP
jgi:N6-L-threonylcarbamoyladenine synthase